MEKKLFASKGIPKKQVMILRACSAILAVAGVFLIIMSNQKRRGISYYTSFDSGTIGGGYLLTDEGRRVFLIMGILLIAFGVGYFIDIFQMQKSMFAVYENHIEGVLYAPVLFIIIKREFNLEYDEIVEVQLSNNFMGSVLKVVSRGGKYGVFLKGDGKKALAYIKQKMKEAA